MTIRALGARLTELYEKQTEHYNYKHIKSSLLSTYRGPLLDITLRKEGINDITNIFARLFDNHSSFFLFATLEPIVASDELQFSS